MLGRHAIVFQHGNWGDHGAWTKSPILRLGLQPVLAVSPVQTGGSSGRFGCSIRVLVVVVVIQSVANARDLRSYCVMEKHCWQNGTFQRHGQTTREMRVDVMEFWDEKESQCAEVDIIQRSVTHIDEHQPTVHML